MRNQVLLGGSTRGVRACVSRARAAREPRLPSRERHQKGQAAPVQGLQFAEVFKGGATGVEVLLRRVVTAPRGECLLCGC